MMRLERVRREIDRVLTNRWITLRLDSWGIGIDGANLVVDALCEPTNNVSWLNLYGNGLGDEGVTAVAHALTNENNKVNVLGLWDNNITDKGLFILAQALENPCCHVRLLDLQDNPVTEAGMEYLIRTVRRRSGIETVMLPRSINPDVVVRLQHVIRTSNSSVTKVLIPLLAVRTIPRIGMKSSLKILPTDILRCIFVALWWNK